MIRFVLLVCLAVLLAIEATTSRTSSTASPRTAQRRWYHPSRRDDHCYFQNRYYRHGERFSPPGSSRCIRYLCWYGTAHMRQEDCEMGGQCHTVGSTFESECSTYRCHKSTRGGYYLYQTLLISSRCKDDNDRCHDPGNYFAKTIRGRYYNRCTCSVSHSEVRYRCSYFSPIDTMW